MPTLLSTARMNSDLQCITAVVNGVCLAGQEPENYTREYGLELRYRF